MRNTIRNLNGIQQKILDAIRVEPRSVADLREVLTVSEVYIRQQIKLLEQAERIEKVDQRQPYIYQVRVLDTETRERIDNIRQGLLDVDKAEKLAPFIQLVHKKPKKDWPLMAEGLQIIVDLIKEMEANGELIDTL